MRVSYVEFLGQKHPICVSLAATEQLVEAFGSLEQFADALDKSDLARTAQAVDTTFQILLKAGRIYASAMGEELPPELPCRPADLIDVRDRSAIAAIFAAMRADTSRTVEVEQKNGEATPDP